MDLQYPIGKPRTDIIFCRTEIDRMIQSMETFPSGLENILKEIPAGYLEYEYRPGSWKLKQVIHHIADAQLNGYIRFKLALTENNPVIKTYEENGWSDLTDAKDEDVSVSVNLIKFLYIRWVKLLKSMDTDDFKKTFVHPDSGVNSLFDSLIKYDWHARHHLEHIKIVLKKNDP